MSNLPVRSKPATPSRILARENERRALELRKAGVSYDVIAKELGYRDHSGAAKAVKRAMARIPKEASEDLHTLTVQRLEHLLVGLWSTAMQKIQDQNEDSPTFGELIDHPDKYRAIDRILLIQDKLTALQGIKPAERVDHNVQHSGGVMVISGDKDEFIRGMRELAGVDEGGTAPLSPAVAGVIEVGSTEVPSKRGKGD